MLSWQQALQQAPELACVSEMLNEVPLGALPVSGGLSNRGWRIASKTHGWVVYRGVGHHCQAFDIDRQNERNVLQVLEQKVPCSTVIASGDSGLLVRWIDGQCLANKNALDESDVFALAVLMAKTHRVEIDRPIRAFNFTEKMDYYWSQISSQEVKRRFREVYQSYRATPNLLIQEHTLCHFDFGAHNIIVGEQAMSVIDWEYAALAPASLDLALTLSMLPERQALFFQHYCRHQPQFSHSRLTQQQLEQDIITWRPYADAMAMLWYLVAAEVWDNPSFVADADEARIRLEANH
ncbi:phosphotransferase [Vibrio hippocampi]|uniref:Thiamine kinase n=1 Tax=Vibrio hippocampi TaxID=654686 RepID=A0ABM8ZG20_9VIBR|nr:phosphotransferase [Vibrio hippocampi]CAH0525553.1 Thiamine kinase [Vibrio hippocampi]